MSWAWGRKKNRAHPESTSGISRMGSQRIVVAGYGSEIQVQRKHAGIPPLVFLTFAAELETQRRIPAHRVALADARLPLCGVLPGDEDLRPGKKLCPPVRAKIHKHPGVWPETECVVVIQP